MIVTLGDLLLDVIVRLEQPLAEGADANAVTKLGPGGQAANVAAKLSRLRESPHRTYVTSDVYENINDEAKYTNGQNMWESRSWTALPSGKQSLYRTGWHWKP